MVILSSSWRLNCDNLHFQFSPFPAMFAKATSVSNPIIYYFMIERFRREVKHTLWKMCFGNRPKSDQESGMQIMATSFRTYSKNEGSADVTTDSHDVTAQVADVIIETNDVTKKTATLKGNTITGKWEVLKNLTVVAFKYTLVICVLLCAYNLY